MTDESYTDTDGVLHLPVRFVIRQDQAFIDETTEYFKNHHKLKPVRFGFDSGHAESLEYGTGPLSEYQPTVHNGNYNRDRIFTELYKWAGKKQGNDGYLPIKDKKERALFAKELTDRFFTYGMKAHPYWRPAVNFLLQNQQRLFDEGHSLYEIADMALKVALKTIMDRNLFFSGELIESAKVKEVDWREVKDGTDYKDYKTDERNRLFKEVGWM